MLTDCAKISLVAAVSLVVTANPGAADTSMILVDAGQGGLSGNVPAWLLATLMAAGAYSFCRENGIGVPRVLKASWSRLAAAGGLMVLGAYALG